MTNVLQGKKILLGVTGSIAAYKAADLASKLVQMGAQVDTVLTDAALKFVTPLTFQSVTAGKALFPSQIIKIVTVCPDYLKPAWELYQKYDDKKFSFTDVTSFIISKDLSTKKVFGFDSDFPKAGFELLI